MPKLFTVRWPLFARLEVVLFFPAAVTLASGFAPVRTIVKSGLIPAASRIATLLGLSERMTFWIATTIVMIVPYLILMLTADRFLTVRKGYALLSVVMIAGWVWAAVRMADVLGAFIPAGLLNSHDLSSGQQVALAVGGIAFLLHLRPIFIGLGDQGDIAMRLLARRITRPVARRMCISSRQPIFGVGKRKNNWPASTADRERTARSGRCMR